jgi:uncharacterized membrane protein
METKMKSFLKQLTVYLKNMPKEERIDVVKEIESHIIMKMEKGMSEEEVFIQLGDPKVLAQSYLGDYLIKQKSNHPRGFLQRFALLMSVHLMSSIVALLLGAVGFAFGLGAIVLFLGAVSSAIFYGLDYIGISSAVHHYSEAYHLPNLSELPAACLVAIFLGLLYFISIKLLRFYFKMVMEKYRNPSQIY